MTHKDLTAHVRKCMKNRKIKASVSKYETCGVKWVRICVPTYESRFTEEELEQIGLIARVNNLTGAKGDPIDIGIMRQLTGKLQHDFAWNPPV